jgi:hypothetical protein
MTLENRPRAAPRRVVYSRKPSRNPTPYGTLNGDGNKTLTQGAETLS